MKKVKVIAALVTAVLMVLLIGFMARVFMNVMGGTLFAAVGDSSVYVPPEEEALWTPPAAQSEPPLDIWSDAAYDDLSGVASDATFDSVAEDMFTYDSAAGDLGEVELLDPEEIDPAEYDFQEDVDQSVREELHAKITFSPNGGQRRVSQILSEGGIRTQIPEDVKGRLYAPITALDQSETEPFSLYEAPGVLGNSPGRIYGDLVGLVVYEEENGFTRVGAHDYDTGKWVEGYVPGQMLKQVEPNRQYSIVIDKRAQTLYLFAGNRLAETWPVSTGEKGNETPAGEFVTGGVKNTILSEVSPEVAYYGVRFNGRIYIHGVPHVQGDYTKAISELGQKASHGCVRIDEAKARWFYENLPERTRVLVLDG